MSESQKQLMEDELDLVKDLGERRVWTALDASDLSQVASDWFSRTFTKQEEGDQDPFTELLWQNSDYHLVADIGFRIYQHRSDLYVASMQFKNYQAELATWVELHIGLFKMRNLLDMREELEPYLT